MPKIVNIAAYKFVPLKELKGLRSRLLDLCQEWELKGTILLSPEGINLFVAGAPHRIDELLAELRSWPGLADLEAKFSETGHPPFTRMLVRIKKEIIAFGVEGIQPAEHTSPKLSPRELKRWLDEGRPVTLLDTRNDYEVRLGTFENALPIGIDHFRTFPDAVRKLPARMKEQPIVMFCTGGIRCEKAGPFMEREGFKTVFQLEGGILKYFEECGGAHYAGECFVFDQRTGVDPGLHETESITCLACQTPLNAEEQRDPRHVPGKSCAYCFRTPEEQMARNITRRHELIRRVVAPLPGSQPYDHLRPLNIPADCERRTLVEALSRAVRSVSAIEWEARCVQGLLLDARYNPVQAHRVVRSGERYYHKQSMQAEPAVNGQVEILHEDEALIVLNKPAPLPMHAGGRFNRNTLHYILRQVYHPQKPRPAHRLDANTTGVVLVTRTRYFAAQLQPQFEKGEVEKVYLVRIQGCPAEDAFVCEAPISLEPGATGTRRVVEEGGLSARTEFRVIHREPGGTTLLEARPRTGRTNQIRVHLWQLGLPVWGDPAYLPNREIGEVQTLGVEAPSLCLHAWRLTCRHPLDGRWLEFTAPLPAWAKAS